MLPAIAAAAGQAVAAERAVVRLEVDGGDDRFEVWPVRHRTTAHEPPGRVVPIADEQGPLGSIGLHVPAGRDVRPFEVRMLEDIADQAAVAFRNVRLQVELAAQVERLDERTHALAASRRRLIDAADTERRRLESALAREVLPTMDSLRTDLADVPAEVDESTVASYVERTTSALEALRELTRGISPTLLTRSGAGRRPHVVRRPQRPEPRALSTRPGPRGGIPLRRASGGGRPASAASRCSGAYKADRGDVAVDLVDDEIVVTCDGPRRR